VKNVRNTVTPDRWEPNAATSVDDATAPDEERPAREGHVSAGGGPGHPLAHEADELATSVYEETFANGPVTVLQVAGALRVPTSRVEQTMHTLRSLRLVKRCEVSGRYRAFSPDAARVELVVPLEEAINDKRRELAGIHERLSSFADTFSALRRSQPRQELVVRCQDPRELGLRMTDAVRDHVGEVLAMWPLGPDRTPQEQPLGVEALSSGARMRILCPHTARTSASVRAGLRRAAAAGARIRTSNHVFDELVVVGEEVAFLSEHVMDQDEPLVTTV
jgi:hypothetical protein